jgi:hypothetical protein
MTKLFPKYCIENDVEEKSTWRIEAALWYFLQIFSPHIAQQPSVGQDLLISEASRSHSDIPHSVGLLWTSDQPDAGRPLPDNTQQSGETDIHAPAGFEPAFSAIERPQTDPLRTLGQSFLNVGILNQLSSERESTNEKCPVFAVNVCQKLGFSLRDPHMFLSSCFSKDVCEFDLCLTVHHQCR